MSDKTITGKAPTNRYNGYGRVDNIKAEPREVKVVLSSYGAAVSCVVMSEVRIMCGQEQSLAEDDIHLA